MGIGEGGVTPELQSQQGQRSGICKSKILLQGGNRSGEQNVGWVAITEKKEQQKFG